MGFVSFIVQEINISNACYMSAAIEFNYALFHIFSGPLFANLQGYAFIDLLIWGISPLLFEMVRNPLKKYVQPNLQQISIRRQSIVRRRFLWLMCCFLAISISYLFMNYSTRFRWNYFSRIVNIDFGYLLFDISCRCMELIVQVQEEQQQLSLMEGQNDNLQVIYHAAGYCKYKNIFMMVSYFLVFYLCTVYDIDDFESGLHIFGALSVISILFSFSVPILYLFKQRNQNYGQVPQEERQNPRQNQKQIAENESSQQETDLSKLYTIFGLISFSYFINVSYFSLWIMQGLKLQKQQTHQQFNKTLFISSAFFLIGSFLLFIITHLYIGCTIRNENEQQLNNSNVSKYIKPFLLFYGALILYVFSVSTKMQWHYMVIPILPFGFQYIIVNYYCSILFQMKEKHKDVLSYQKLFFYCETITYFIIPALLKIFNLGDSTAIYLFGLLSGTSLLVAGVFI